MPVPVLVRVGVHMRLLVPVRVLMRLLVPVLVLAGCAAVPVRVEPARLRVIAVPESAAVYVDGRFAGSARLIARRPVAFPASTRHVTVQADGYFPHDVEVELRPGLTTMRVALRPVPP